eukprot:m.165466 g.165466  ORF g.165466 m.165466 type:complete len:78 (-) comp23999_c0_seq2:114-347(-)
MGRCMQWLPVLLATMNVCSTEHQGMPSSSLLLYNFIILKMYFTSVFEVPVQFARCVGIGIGFQPVSFNTDCAKMIET